MVVSTQLTPEVSELISRAVRTFWARCFGVSPRIWKARLLDTICQRTGSGSTLSVDCCYRVPRERQLRLRVTFHKKETSECSFWQLASIELMDGEGIKTHFSAQYNAQENWLEYPQGEFPFVDLLGSSVSWLIVPDRDNTIFPLE